MTKLISLGILIIFFLSIGCSKQNDAADPASVQPNDAPAFSERNNQTVFQNDSQNFFNQTNPFNESNQYKNNQRETNYKTVTMNDSNLNVPFAMIQIPETWTASSDIRWINSDPYVIYKVFASDMSNTESFAFYSYMKTENYISPESFFNQFVFPSLSQEMQNIQILNKETEISPQLEQEIASTENSLKRLGIKPVQKGSYEALRIFSSGIKNGVKATTLSRIAILKTPEIPIIQGTLKEYLIYYSSLTLKETDNNHLNVVFDKILASLKSSPQWEAAKSNIIAQKVNSSVNAQTRAANQFSQTMSQITEEQLQMFYETSSVQDRVTELHSEHIRDVDNLTNPFDQSQFEADSFYNKTWVNQSGDMIQTDSEFYNPNTDPMRNNSDWQEAN